MDSGRVAIRYANGLLKFSDERGISDVLYADAKKLILILSDSHSLEDLMHNPSIASENKLEVLKRTIAETVHPSFYVFLETMVKKGRFDYLQNSLLLYRDLYRKKNGIVDIQVESANKLSDNELNAIDNLIKSHFNKKTEITVTVKPQLIAGFILIVEGKIMDCSVTGQLSSFRKSLRLTDSN